MIFNAITPFTICSLWVTAIQKVILCKLENPIYRNDFTMLSYKYFALFCSTSVYSSRTRCNRLETAVCGSYQLGEHFLCHQAVFPCRPLPEGGCKIFLLLFVCLINYVIHALPTHNVVWSLLFNKLKENCSSIWKFWANYRHKWV